MWKTATLFLLGLIVAAAGTAAWMYFSRPDLPPGFVASNGRLEANQLFIAAKRPGRVEEVLFDEGDTVEAGQVVARMDTDSLEASLREAEAKSREAEDSRKVALADVAVKRATLGYAEKQYKRSQELVTKGAVSEQEAEIDYARLLANRAELVGAEARAVQTVSAIAAAKAEVDRLESEIADSVLVSPIRARIDTRLAEPGEVIGPGGRVFSALDLSDVYMYVFLPEQVTGKIALGSEARIVLDAAPGFPIRASVSYVSALAQFTPKAVETAEERHNLTFRVKLQIDRTRLREFERFVKAGIPGMGYVRFDGTAQWPDKLQPRQVDPETLWQPTGASGSPAPAPAAPAPPAAPEPPAAAATPGAAAPAGGPASAPATGGAR